MICSMMRIKNEQRFIARSIESQLPVSDQLFIMDDHSTDETREICRSYPKVTLFESPFAGLNETRDKNWLLEKVEKLVPEATWCICIDGDEELAAGSTEQIRWIVDRQGASQGTFRFQVIYLWDSEAQYRADGIYANFHRPSMFRVVPGQRFRSSAGGGFHCSNTPNPAGSVRTNIKLLHYGYLHQSDRLRKFEWYNAPDKQPIPDDEDGYRHMVIGDIFPASARFRHAGPLQLKPLDSLIPYVAAV